MLGLSESSLKTLLTLYPVSDFTHLVRPGEEDATAQYYRAAQMNRDILFTCPAIDFTWQYYRHGGSDIRIYGFNQTKFGPILDCMGVPQWRVSHLADIPYFMNEDVIAGGNNSAPQKELSELLSGSVAAFAHTGDPNSSEGKAFKGWPLGYEGQTAEALRSDYPERLEMYVMGGPYGNGPARIASSTAHLRFTARELAWEKVIDRCRFINSIHAEIGV